MSTYWDTSCVLKLYVQEPDSLEWAAKARTEDLPLRSSALLRAELAFAVRAKEQRGHLRTGGAEGVIRAFEEDLLAGRYELIPVGTDVLDQACQLAALWHNRDLAPPLRTLDGIHLATAHALKCRTLATADDRLAKAAARVGLDLL